MKIKNPYSESISMSGKTRLDWQLLANLLQHDVSCELKESEETGQLVVVKKLIGMRTEESRY